MLFRITSKEDLNKEQVQLAYIVSTNDGKAQPKGVAGGLKNV